MNDTDADNIVTDNTSKPDLSLPNDKKRNKKKAPLIATSVFAVIAVVAAVYWFSYGQYFESTDNAYLQSNVTTISPKVSGYIIKSFVKDNEHVKAGQLLVQIDDKDYVQALNKAKANLAQSQANVQNLLAERNLQNSKINQASSQIAAAKAQYKLATQEVNRITSLKKKNYASQNELDTDLSQQKVTLANVNEAEANYKAATDEIAVIDSQITEAKATVEEATAELNQAQLNLSYTKVYAPVSGVVGNRSLRVGMLVQAGTPLLSLVPTQNVWLVANFKETQISAMKKGQHVEIDLDAYPDVHLKGVVDSFSPGTGAQFALLPPENATGNFTKIVQRVPVKIDIVNPEILKGRLIPGLSVTATVDTRG
ncbi:HlyD family secretion protein [Vibrio sp. S4M6]|uniref:HlyD family secretion protein n=1 Tax=Vibrio sinus TaxID=2946865 RepID=UPI00202A7DCE|nr:HlyD family secretion protein [Vibrio sinus]MCL9783976.1 HlyD family secretion protein [Vibrio sinus]